MTLKLDQTLGVCRLLSFILRNSFCLTITSMTSCTSTFFFLQFQCYSSRNVSNSPHQCYDCSHCSRQILHILTILNDLHSYWWFVRVDVMFNISGLMWFWHCKHPWSKVGVRSLLLGSVWTFRGLMKRYLTCGHTRSCWCVTCDVVSARQRSCAIHQKKLNRVWILTKQLQTFVIVSQHKTASVCRACLPAAVKVNPSAVWQSDKVEQACRVTVNMMNSCAIRSNSVHMQKWSYSRCTLIQKLGGKWKDH